MFFGGTYHGEHTYAPKVAVLASDFEGTHATLITNYNRDAEKVGEKSSSSHNLFRAGDPSMEFKIWEAAAATNATREYYKAFMHNTTRKRFFDGALYSSNPAKIALKECSFIWPEMAKLPLDMLISLGTGQHSSVINQQLGEVMNTKYNYVG